jgi:hypothetical protein
MYSLFVFDEHGEEFRAGSVKIGQVGMETGQRRPNIPEEFDELGEPPRLSRRLLRLRMEPP